MILSKKPQRQLFFITMLLWFLFFSVNTFGQNLTQTIRGYVTDADNHNGLIGASVYIPSLEKGVTTDENGSFRMEEIPVGRYSIQTSYIGYSSLIISEILLESGKEMVLEIKLQPSSSNLDEIVVKGLAPNQRDKVYPAHEIFTIEETLRLPATFFDPARLAFSYAGVTTNNDQANHMIIRGNTPNNMSWRLEGVEIVNPNHLTNAGTSTDRPSKNGGGVNILSAQLLGNSTFMRGAFPASYGNVLGGVMDMNFRKGNNEKYGFTGQIGVIGIDLSAEGPISDNKKASFLVNYRYSTLGLLGSAGVDLGDESINFQDFALNINVPLSGTANLSIFGFKGNSENDFQSKEGDDREFDKDNFDINYTSHTWAAGYKFEQKINDQWRFDLTGVFSTARMDRSSSIDTSAIKDLFDLDEIFTQKFSTNASLNYKLNSRSRFHFGIINTWLRDRKKLFSFVSNDIVSGGTIDGTLLQPYLDWKYNWSNLTLNLGVRSVLFTFNNTSSWEPNGSLKWNLKNKQSLVFAYGLQSQRQLPQVYQRPIDPNDEDDNSILELTKAHHFSFLYEKKWSSRILRLEAYYQSLFDVPIAKDIENSFSTLNVFAGTVNLPLVNDGTGKNYGIELTAQQYFSNNSFWLGNISLYESKYTGSDGIERDTRFNGNYIINATYGKEFPYSKKGKDYILGVNLHVNYSGGLRESPIDEVASNLFNRTIFDEENAFSLQQQDYFKSDLRIYWKRNKKRFNSTLALDIQNVTNAKNPSFRYYDTFRNEIVQNFQLGLIPILSYRIEF